jgi:protein-S-isoprenylcysteine O-methyltransferase Ste14
LIGELIRLLIAAACALFVLSLPLSKTDTGATLRRWAGVCFVLAFLPSLIGGLFYSASISSTSTTTTSAPSPAGDFFSSLGCIAAVIILGLLAYGVLKLRSRFISKAKPQDPWQTFFNRGGGKRPFTMNPKATRSHGPVPYYDDEDDD